MRRTPEAQRNPAGYVRSSGISYISPKAVLAAAGATDASTFFDSGFLRSHNQESADSRIARTSQVLSE
jgi:hypothetical protein